jgi:hypothetical protein
MQTLCPMNVHRRKTQKFEFQKKKKARDRHHHRKHHHAEQHRKEIRIVPRFFFQQQQRENNLYFPLRERERGRKRRKAQESANIKIGTKKIRSAPACYLLRLGKQQ